MDKPEVRTDQPGNAPSRGPGGASLALVAALLSAPGLWAAPARADVLEIGAGGATWIAGGPATPAPPLAQPVERAYTASQIAAGPDRWRTHVAQLAQRYDISPALLEAVVWQESRWNEGAVSPAGAHGLAQLMPATGRQLGVDWRDPAQNLEGGARYLREQLDRFGGNVEAALAAYNAGPRRVQQAGGVPAIAETRRYVAAIMARLAQPVRR